MNNRGVHLLTGNRDSEIELGAPKPVPAETDTSDKIWIAEYPWEGLRL
jgi:hypothetical protein